ncbi:hypothetical protein B0H10DRAFT_2210371 [Mycena sp. CBHHK59/15]|nr:hypothetical protein B0H10DRAFT_2210371 [Mycena sp. CBHHK59/15]
MSTPNIPPSPAALKKFEKQLNKEAKREDSEVKHALKDVQATEKSRAKTQKSAIKAEQTIGKLAKVETATLKALNKATHHHDAVVVDLRSAEKDAEIKRHEDEKLAAELGAKKARAAEALQAQLAHAEERQTKLREMREGAGLPVE